ncbi:hypothetical protein PS3A_46430 [Pseudomonas sp. 3A(2025)]
MKKPLYAVLAALLSFTPVAIADAETEALIAKGQWQQVADRLYLEVLEAGYSKTVVARTLSADGREEQAVALIKACCYSTGLIDVAVLSRQSSHAQRLAILDQVARDNPRNPQQLKLAQAYLKYGRTDQALQIYNTYLQTAVADNLSLSVLVESVIATNNKDMMSRMLPVLSDAAQRLSNKVLAAKTYALLAIIQARLGQMPAAEAALQQAYDRVERKQRKAISESLVQAALIIDRPDLADQYNEDDDQEWRNWALYHVNKGDYQGAVAIGMKMTSKTVWVKKYVHIEAIDNARTSPNMPALVAFIESVKDEKPSRYVQDLQDIAIAYAIKGDSAQARATLARAADSLTQDGAADLNGLLLTARLASLALQRKFDDIAQPAMRALPERLQKMQTDAYGYAEAWQAISKTHSFIADQTLVRHSMAQAYSATQPLIQKSLDDKNFRRSDNVRALLLSMARSAQRMADATKAPLKESHAALEAP